MQPGWYANTFPTRQTLTSFNIAWARSHGCDSTWIERKSYGLVKFLNGCIAMFLFKSPDDEMSAGNVLKMLNKNQIDPHASKSAKQGNGLCSKMF